MADNLKKILQVMEGWAQKRLQIETMSVTERKEHDQEVRQWIEERKRKGGDPK
jgi:hypothetical protein